MAKHNKTEILKKIKKHIRGPLPGSSLELKNSQGLAEYKIRNTWATEQAEKIYNELFPVEPPKTPKVCWNCDGAGTVMRCGVSDNMDIFEDPCDECHGTGVLSDEGQG